MFANPLGLIALLAVPAVVALHLLRRRFTPRVVSALFLWEDPDRAAAEGRRWERLRATIPLLLESAAALLLALALAGPRGCEDGGRHLVILLDGSASMAARGADGRAASERAAQRAAARLDALGGRDRVTLLESGPRASVLAGPEATVEEARAALRAWDPRGPDADPSTALGLAAALAGEGEILWLTDRLPDEAEAPPARVSLVAVGESLSNAGFVEVSRTVDALGWTLRAFSAAPLAGAVEVELPGADPLRVPFALTDGAEARGRVALPAGADRVVARLVSAEGGPWKDALSLDDQLVTVAPPRRVLHLGSALPPSMNRALGLSAGPTDALGVGRWVAAVPDSEAAPAERADLRLALEAAPAGEGWTVRLSGPASPETPSAERALLGPFLASGHPLMASWSGQGLIWTPGARVALGPEDEPLLLAGDRALIVLHAAGAGPRLSLDIDPWRSTLARRADWPLFLAGIAELRRAALPGPERLDLRAGETLSWPGLGPGEVVLRDERGERRLSLERDLLLELPRVGETRLRTPGGEERIIAVNLLSPEESELRTRGTGERPAAVGPSEASLGAGGAASVLALLALGLLVLDWALLERGAGR